MRKRLISILLAFALAIGMVVPMSSAEETEIDTEQEAEIILETEPLNDVAEDEVSDEETYVLNVETIDEPMVFTDIQGGIEITVTAPLGAFPDGTEMELTVYDENSLEYENTADIIQSFQLADDMTYYALQPDPSIAWKVGFEGDMETIVHDEMIAMDISFLYCDNKIEPECPVDVVINVTDVISEECQSDITFTHLTETEDGIVPETVAIVDYENPIAEFETDSFSEYVVEWEWNEQSGSTSSTYLYLTVYLDGVEISDFVTSETINVNGTEYPVVLYYDNQDDELDLNTLLKDIGYGTGDYTFEYATAVYEVTSSGSGGGPSGGSGTTTEYTAGSESNPILSVSKNGGGSVSFILSLADGTTVNTSGSSSGGGGGNSGSAGTVYITAYFTTPDMEVTIQGDATNNSEDWLLEADVAHIGGDYSYIEYEWWITETNGSDTDKAYVSWTDETGAAFIVWDTDNVSSGDEVIAHVKATAYDEYGNVVNSAEGEYVLEYASETITLTLTYGANKTTVPSGTTVTLTNESTGEVVTATVGNNGQVVLNALEPGVYNVYVSYTNSNGSTYVFNDDMAFHDKGSYEATLILQLSEDEKTELPENAAEKTDWNHVDVKLTTGSSSNVSNQDITLDIIGSKIYDEDGKLLYIATEDSIQGYGNEWQLYYYSVDESGNPTGSASHTLSFSTGCTIELTYTITWTDEWGQTATQEFTVDIDQNTLYGDDFYYPADGARAYNLYNYLYGTSYTSNAQMIADGIEEIDISGMSMMLVAALLCDSAETGTGAGVVTGTAGMWGLDFTLDIESMIALGTYWDYEVSKTFLNHEMTNGMFSFTLYDGDEIEEDTLWAIQIDDNGNYASEETLTNETVHKDVDGNSETVINGTSIPYTDQECIDGETFYYILTETDKTISHVIYDDTVYGIKVQLSAVVGDNDVIEGKTVDVTYYFLSDNGNGTYTVLSEIGTQDDDDDTVVFEFSNEWYNGILMEKRNENESLLSNAEFTLTCIDEDGTIWYFDGNEGFSEEYTTFTMGSIVLGMPPEAEYTLTEISAPSGYDLLPQSVVFEVNDENLIVIDSVRFADGSSTDGYIVWDEDSLILTVIDAVVTFGFELVKTDEFGNQLTEAEFRFVYEDGTIIYFTYEDGVYTADSGSQLSYVTVGDAIVDGLLRGTYTITEIVSPDGFSYDSPSFIVTIGDNGEITVDGDNVSLNDEGAVSVVTVENFAITSVEGTKIWVGDDDYLEERPESITVTLYADDVEITSTTVTADDDWYYSFAELPVYDDDGNEIVYTIKETTVNGYTTEYDGYDIINTYDTTPTFDVLFYKYVDDGNTGGGGSVLSGMSKIPNLNSPSFSRVTDTYTVSNTYLQGAGFVLSQDGLYAVVEAEITQQGYTIYTIVDWVDDETKASVLVSDIDGCIEIANMTEGIYTLTEVSTPSGYILLTDSIELGIDSEGYMYVISGPAEMDGTRLSIGNEQITGSFEIEKTNIKNETLANAKFILGYFWTYNNNMDYEYWYADLLYDEESQSYSFDMYNDEVERDNATIMTTNENGIINITDLPLSSIYDVGYFLIEVEAPDGYEIMENPIVFTVSDDGSIEIIIYNDNDVSLSDDVLTIIDKNVTYEFSLQKTDMEYNVLSGAEFFVQSDGYYLIFEDNGDSTYTLTGYSENSADTTVITSGEDGMIHFVEIPEGTYYIYESKAPDGYARLTEPITVIVTADGITVEGSDLVYTTDEWSFTVQNMPLTQMPNASSNDSSVIWIIVGLSVVVFGAFIAMFVRTYNSKKYVGKRLRK